MRRALWIFAIVIVVVFLGMQFHRPNFGLEPVNPHATLEAQLHPDAQIHNALRRSCYDCHSAEVKVPWYGHVWPASALLQNDIRKGRAYLDFSNWSNLSTEMSQIRLISACREMRGDEMPLWYYRPMHPGASPKDEDVEAFCSWVQTMRLRSGVAEVR
ncbi:MAG: heme-binding domain-containing protein [Acidobacteriota bacterium]